MSMMGTRAMTAAYITALGPPERIQVGELPVPTPGPTDALVRVEVVAINPVDTFIRSGAYRTPTPFPFVIGRDLVGTVEEAGPGCVGLEPGARVWANSLGHGGRQGPSAQFAVVAADRLYPLPAGVDGEQAVAAAHPAATAYLGLFRHARLCPGETVYIGGGAGNIGAIATVMAADAGARVVVSARPDDEERCRAAGAQAVVDYRAPDLAARIAAAAPRGVDVWWDTAGHHDLHRVVPLLAHGGRIVLAAGMTEQPPLPTGQLFTRDASIVGFVISNATVADLARAAQAVNRLLANGRLPVRIAEVLPLAAAAEAHRRLENRTEPVRGRLLLRP